MKQAPDFVTVLDVAIALGIPQTRVSNFIRTRNIQPLRPVGATLIYPPELISMVKAWRDSLPPVNVIRDSPGISYFEAPAPKGTK